MTDFAEKCRSMMARGAVPPRNWQDRVSYVERTCIYDAYVEHYIGLIRDGRELPKRGWCARGLSDAQKARIYAARGFGSTGTSKYSIAEAKKDAEERKERQLWLMSHGGQHTQDVMAAAAEARKRRSDYLRRKYQDKRLRRALSQGWRGLTRRYWDWCDRVRDYHREERKREKITWENIRRDIVNKAIALHAQYEEEWKTRREIRRRNKRPERNGVKSVTKIRQDELVAIYKFIARMFNAVEVYCIAGDLGVDIQHKEDVLKCLDFIAGGVIPTSFLTKVMRICPDYERKDYQDVFSSIEDALEYVNDGCKCLFKKMKGLKDCGSHRFLNGLNDPRYCVKGSKKRRRKALAAKKELLLLKDAYAKIAELVPDIKTVEWECSCAFEKASLRENLDRNGMNAGSAFRQLRALGFVA